MADADIDVQEQQLLEQEQEVYDLYLDLDLEQEAPEANFEEHQPNVEADADIVQEHFVQEQQKDHLQEQPLEEEEEY